ncbi:MAG: OmpA family protein [Anaerobutyricum hallii]
MKNKWIKNMVFIAMISVVCVLTGCDGNKGTSTKDKSKPAVAYMVAHTANAKAIDSSAPIVQDTMLDCAENYGYTFMIRVDGEPQVVSAENLDIPAQYKSASKERLQADARNEATNLLNILDGIDAVEPEVDYWEGLRLAGASLQSLDNSYTSRTIISCGTGLGTTGYLDFKNNLLSADPKDVVEILQQREALPDLKGITVYWIGMAQVIAPQEKLTPKQAKNLERIWKAVVEASGGEFVPNDYITVTSETASTDDLPSVSVIDIPADKPVVFESQNLESDDAFDEPVMLSESQVEFVADEANYLHPDKAIATIRPIADYLLKHDKIKLLLAGCTAGDVTDEFTIRLSKERATMVQNTLIDLGVEKERLITVGLGSDDPWHIKGAEGKAASGNRKVVLMDMRTEQAQKLQKLETNSEKKN